MSDRYPHVFEAKIEFKTAKCWIVDLTLGGKYFLPFKCTSCGENGLEQPDEYGNFVFEVNDWWWKKRDDFEIKD